MALIQDEINSEALMWNNEPFFLAEKEYIRRLNYNMGRGMIFI